MKLRLLGVRQENLDRAGAVSYQVALEMARGASRHGRRGGAEHHGGRRAHRGDRHKPLGLYYIGLATPQECWSWRHDFRGNREENNENAARAALSHLLDYLG